MDELLLYITLFIAVYFIDLATALLHRKMRPYNFKLTEANQRFRKCLEQRGILGGIYTYIILSSTEAIILFISVGVAARIIFDSTIKTGLMFTFLLLIIIHILGTITNLIALCKKDKKPISINLSMNLNKSEVQNG